jgi:transcriptional regulator with XRE-family HTH domain
MSFGKRIFELRSKLSLPQKDIAKAGGVSVPAVAQWESGSTKKVDAMILSKVAVFLGVTSEELLHGTENPSAIKASIVANDERIPLINKNQISKSMIFSEIETDEFGNSEICKALSAGPRTFSYIEKSEGMSQRITPKDTVYIDMDGKMEPNSIGIFLFKLDDSSQLGTLKKTPQGLVLQFDNNSLGWDDIPVNEDDYIGRLVAYVPHWLPKN